MQSREIVKRAIEFRYPPRLPFYLSGSPDYPDDVLEIREMEKSDLARDMARAHQKETSLDYREKSPDREREGGLER